MVTVSEVCAWAMCVPRYVSAPFVLHDDE